MRPGGIISGVDSLELEEFDGVVEEREDNDGENVTQAVVLARLSNNDDDDDDYDDDDDDG